MRRHVASFQSADMSAHSRIDTLRRIDRTQAGKNIVAAIRGGAKKPFVFTTLGQLATIGRRTGVANILGRQQRGYIAPELDPRHVLLAMVSLTTYALAFPQVARLITGLGPDDPQFRVERTAFLRWMGSALRPGSGERRGREMAQRRKIKGQME